MSELGHKETVAIHAGYAHDSETGAVMPPIFMTSTYAQEYPGKTHGYDYTRSNNPNFTILEAQIAALEGAKFATVFSSGLGALTALIHTLSPGDEVLALKSVYGGTFRLFHRIFSRFGVTIRLVSSLDDVGSAATEKTKWLLFETPTNPLLETIDIKRAAAVASKKKLLAVVDNTFATPALQNPLSLGADIVWHSTTKYMGGHSDVVGGSIATNNPKLKEQLDFHRMAIGINPSPFDTWLVSRGLKTLHLRMERHTFNGQKAAQFLKKHPKVRKVYYPGFGGMVSCEFALSFEETMDMIRSYRLFTLAESLGGVESLVCHPATMTHASIPQEERRQLGLSDSLVRFSIGIEHIDDLIADLKEALINDGAADF